MLTRINLQEAAALRSDAVQNHELCVWSFEEQNSLPSLTFCSLSALSFTSVPYIIRLLHDA